VHELAITRNIVAIVGEAARGQCVTRVTLEIGKLTCVMADAVSFCFDTVAADTPLAGAVLDIREIEGSGRCHDCGAEFAVETLFTACPCGSRDCERLSGEELTIKSFELAEREAA